MSQIKFLLILRKVQKYYAEDCLKINFTLYVFINDSGFWNRSVLYWKCKTYNNTHHQLKSKSFWSQFLPKPNMRLGANTKLLFWQFVCFIFVLNDWKRILNYKKFENTKILSTYNELKQVISKKLFIQTILCKIYLEN